MRITNFKKQKLDQHLFAVGFLAYYLVKGMVDDESLARGAFIAGCWHDVGKLDPKFQTWMGKQKISDEIPDDGQHIGKKLLHQTHPRHNEISLLLNFLQTKATGLNPQTLKSVQHAIYWHHAKPSRKDDFKTLSTILNKLERSIGELGLNYLFSETNVLIKEVEEISKAYFQEAPVALRSLIQMDSKEELKDKVDTYGELPPYKEYQVKEDLKDYQRDIRKNAKNNIIRAALITANHLVTKISSYELEAHLKERTLESLLSNVSLKDSTLSSSITSCLNSFGQEGERNLAQKKVAVELSDEEVKVAVLRGPAGCGKTKIALEWALNTNARKIIWICPRIQICQGLFKDLTSEDYIFNSKVEICTGEIKQTSLKGQVVETEEPFTGDIVITTIDQIISSIITHQYTSKIVDYLNSHVVFDEFHEYINMKALNLLFAELVSCKQLKGTNARTLLVSATPNPFFIDSLLNIDSYDIVEMQNFNKSLYEITIEDYDEFVEDESNPLYQRYPEDTFIISNTAITAQKSYIANQGYENSILFHSKYCKEDRIGIFNEIFESFKENGTKNCGVLRSGPVIQASLNITCKRIISEMTMAENFLQRLGRLDRFGKNTEVNEYKLLITDGIKRGKAVGNCGRFLNTLHCLNGTVAWYDFLESKKVLDREITLEEIYEVYKEFYTNEAALECLELDLSKALRESVFYLNKNVFNPICLVPKKSSKTRIKKHSLRGYDRFVKMANCVIEDRDNIEIQDSYTEDGITLGVNLIRGYGNGKKDLLDFMVRKHHNIIQGAKKPYNEAVLLAEARDMDKPIYTSYTEEDLKKVESEGHPHAVYYAMGVKRPIGFISLNNLKEKYERNS